MSLKKTDLFRHLDEAEEKEFRDWARSNYEIYTDIKSIWHPVSQHECAVMNLEYYEESKTDFHY